MDIEELVQARQFGISTKDIRESVGFRGIGIYSGFNLCNRLLITTKKAGEESAYVMEFDFAAMKRQLDSDVQSKTNRTSLMSLLEQHSRFTREAASDLSQHYTVVQLEDISDEHIAELSDRAKLRTYILRNLPIDFDDSFTHREAINAALAANVPGFKAVKVLLESDDAPSDLVVKPAIPDLGPPQTGLILHGEEPIAFYWACLHEAPPTEDDSQQRGPRGRIPDEYADHRGFVYKMKGFTIGDNTKLRDVFRRGTSTLYWWYAGEIYVIDPKVLPNTARDDFETNNAQRRLEKHVHDTLRSLETRVAQHQENERALRVFTDRQKYLLRLEEAIRAASYPPLDTYSEVDKVIDDLKGQKNKLPKDDRTWGQDIITRFEKAKRQIGEAIDNPQPIEKVRRTGATRRSQAQASQAATKLIEPVASPPPVRRLSQIIEDAGWDMAREPKRLVDLIDQSLADVLNSGSPRHIAVLVDIEAKVLAELTQ